MNICSTMTSYGEQMIAGIETLRAECLQGTGCALISIGTGIRSTIDAVQNVALNVIHAISELLRKSDVMSTILRLVNSVSEIGQFIGPIKGFQIPVLPKLCADMIATFTGMVSAKGFVHKADDLLSGKGKGSISRNITTCLLGVSDLVSTTKWLGEAGFISKKVFEDFIPFMGGQLNLKLGQVAAGATVGGLAINIYTVAKKVYDEGTINMKTGLGLISDICRVAFTILSQSSVPAVKVLATVVASCGGACYLIGSVNDALQPTAPVA